MGGRLPTLCLVCISVFYCLIFPAFALDSYIDDMVSAQNRQGVSYSGLRAHVLSAPHPDGSALVLPSCSAVGTIEYEISGAERIDLTVYHRSGTFVSENPGKPGVYWCGVNRDLGYLSSQKVVQALYSRMSGSVYYKKGGSYWPLKINDLDYSFEYLFDLEAASQPSAAEIAQMTPFGAGLSVSRDGQNFSPVAPAYTRVTNLEHLSAVYMVEELSAPVPAGVRYIRIDINDCHALPLLSGGMWDNFRNPTAIARVAFSGKDIRLGPQEAAVSSGGGESSGGAAQESSVSEPDSSVESSVPDESSGEKSSRSYREGGGGGDAVGFGRDDSVPAFLLRSGSSSGSTASRRLSSSVPSPPAAPGGASSPAPAKFSGVLTASSGRAQTQAGSSSREFLYAEQEPVSSKNAASVMYEVMPTNGEEGRFRTGITAYTIAVSGGVLYLLLRPGRER